MPPVKLVGKSTRVVDTPQLHIDELYGNVASSSDSFSVARVEAQKGTSIHLRKTLCYPPSHSSDYYTRYARFRMSIHRSK